eukprot:gene20281-22267_t
MFLKLVCLSHLLVLIGCQYLDDFQRSLCRERWKRMDWQQMLRPCRDNLEFGTNKWDDKLRTSPKYSHVLNMDIKKTGEFSKIAIQSRTAEGREKSIGGDTWRVFITGPSHIAPFVSDLENGVYEATFMAMEPGFYKAKIYLESTLCDGLKDPPKYLLKQAGIKRDGREGEYSKGKLWKPIRGDGASFKIEPNEKSTMPEIQKKLNRWKDSCGPDYKCDLLWQGFGRWVNKTWKPFIEELHISGSKEEEAYGKECIRKNNGKLVMYGDEFAKNLFDANPNKNYFNGLFQHVQTEYNGGLTQRDSLPEKQQFSVKSELKKLEQLVQRKDMDEQSVLLLNYGLPFVERMSFAAYRRMIDWASRTLTKYKGQPVLRTISALQKPNDDPVKAFQNYQRSKLFNAYTLSKMCSQGYPNIDVFDMTGSAPNQPTSAETFDYSVVKPMETILKNYFETRTSKKCAREKVFKKIKSTVAETQTMKDVSSGSGSGTDESSKSVSNGN